MARKDKNGLTDKQRNYCRERVKGKSQRQAYKAAYDVKTMSDNAVDVAASRLESSTKVSLWLDHLRALDNEKTIASRDDMAKTLTDFISDDSISMGNRLKAIDILAKLSGCYSDGATVNVSQSVITATDKSKAIAAYLQDLTNTK